MVTAIRLFLIVHVLTLIVETHILIRYFLDCLQITKSYCTVHFRSFVPFLLECLDIFRFFFLLHYLLQMYFVLFLFPIFYICLLFNFREQINWNIVDFIEWGFYYSFDCLSACILGEVWTVGCCYWVCSFWVVAMGYFK